MVYFSNARRSRGAEDSCRSCLNVERGYRIARCSQRETWDGRLSRPEIVRGGFVPAFRFVVMTEALEVPSIITEDTGSSWVRSAINKVALIIIL